MASTKAGGSAKNLTDSGPKYLGVKLADGASARPGMIIVRQRGTKIEAGKNVKVGKDHTLFAIASGKVSFVNKRFTRYDGRIVSKKVASVA
jgi:large subunit ribosomal protein L27